MVRWRSTKKVIPATTRKESIHEQFDENKKENRADVPGPVQVLPRVEYKAYDMDSKVACIQAFLPLGLLYVQELLEEEVCMLAGGSLCAEISRVAWAAAWE